MKSDSEKGKYTSPDGSAIWEYVSVMSCSSLVLCCGCIVGWSSPTLSLLMSPGSPIPLTSSNASTLAAISTIGHTLASALTIIMADKLGRKNSLLAGGVPLIVSWVMIAMTDQITVLLVARFIAGITFGLSSCIPPMYLGEISSPNLRGVVGIVSGIMFNSGMLFVFGIGPYLSMKMTAIICLCIATLTVTSVWFIPDSPYFLAMVGKNEEAEDALMKLRGKTDVAEELELIKITVSRKKTGKENIELMAKEESDKIPEKSSALRQLFTVSGNLKALAINLLFSIVMQLGGYVIIVVYGNIIFDKMNTRIEPHVCTMIIATIQLVCSILVAFVIDKVGRRPLILISGLVSGLCVLIVGVYFYLMEYTDVDVTPYGLFALGAIFLNSIAANIGLVPLQIVIQSEILGTEVKAVATCLLGVGGGAMSTIGAKSYLMVAETWDYGHSVPFIVFAAITWFSTFAILKLLPETKGRTLLDIQRDLNA